MKEKKKDRENLRLRRKKLLRRLLGILLILALGGILFVLILNAVIKAKTSSRILSEKEAEELEDVDCILVLGCRVRDDGSLSAMLTDRVRQGEALYFLGAAPKLLMSGDHGNRDYNEVGAMKKRAAADGVAEEDIFMDHAGFCTYDSVVRASEVFDAKRIIIVTQKYHLYRALYIAQRMGLDAYGVASDYRSYFKQSYYSLREMAARVKDWFFCLVKPAPGYLGDTIDLSGSGSVTDDEAYRDLPVPGTMSLSKNVLV